MQGALGKNRFWREAHCEHPAITASQQKLLNKLLKAGLLPGAFEGGLSTEKYVVIARLSRATAYRQQTLLVEARLLHKTGQGRGRGMK